MSNATQPACVQPAMTTPARSNRRWFVVCGFLAVLIAAPFAYWLGSGWVREWELEGLYREIDAEDLTDNQGKLSRTRGAAGGTDFGVELWLPALRAAAPVEPVKGKKRST